MKPNPYPTNHGSHHNAPTIQRNRHLLRLLTPRRNDIPKILEIGSTIPENPDEDWADDSVHTFYKVPMQAVTANPCIAMHCEVHRDDSAPTPVSVNRWVNTEYFIWSMAAGLADGGRNAEWSGILEARYRGGMDTFAGAGGGDDGVDGEVLFGGFYAAVCYC